MPIRNIERVKLNLKQKIDEIATVRTQRAVYAILSQGQAMAALMVPIDTSFLLNSAFGPVMIDDKRGRVGYAAEYAKWVHDAPGTLKGQPRAHFGKTGNHSGVGPQSPVSFGGGTGIGTYWSPNAEPGFLVKGFDQIKPSIPAILKAVYGS